ncbi:hypothetical protein GCM10009844_39660 [Nocardioides koreensis]|uniref:DUF202 domain-containing protein n=2 Tax=Nocardioides koreensis TaxID=433651 RepID=A0ABN3A599_9ACTN
MGLCLVLAGVRLFVVGRRAASRVPDRDRALDGALLTVLGLVLSGFGIVVLAVTAMLVRAMA